MSAPAHIFKCTNCGSPLGVSQGGVLRLTHVDERTGDIIVVEFSHKVFPRCGNCKRQRRWAPETPPRHEII